jgi:hypothetical protein
MLQIIVRSCLIKIFDNSIMPKRRARKLKGGEPLATTMPPPQMGNMPTMSPSQGAAVKNSSVVPQTLPPTPSPIKSPPPAAKVSPPVKSPPVNPPSPQPKAAIPPPTSSEKTLATAEESIGFLEKYGYEIAIAGVVILIISIVVYYLFIRDIPGEDSSDDSGNGGSASPASATPSPPATPSQTATASSPPVSSSEPEPVNATEDNEETPDTPQESDGGGSTEGFTVEILDGVVNNKQDIEFEPGRPDIWKPEENSLLPGQNI